MESDVEFSHIHGWTMVGSLIGHYLLLEDLCTHPNKAMNYQHNIFNYEYRN